MSRKAQSDYIRHHRRDPLIRRWIATILLKSDLRGHLMFGSLRETLIAGFDATGCTKENLEDPEFVRGWLERERSRCGTSAFDESDVFCVNTASIGKAMGLNATELAILRFACLLNSYRPLDEAADVCGDMFTESDLCELLADLLRRPFDAVYDALHPSGLLRRSGLVRPNGSWVNCRRLGGWLATPAILAAQVFRAQGEDNTLMGVFYRQGPKSTLTQYDFPQRSELGLIKDYLRASYRGKSKGANVLLWGRPGTGKTEMARHVAQSLRKRALEINTMDADGEGLAAYHRLDCYRFCQAVIGRSRNALVVFDEVEDVLSDGGFASMGFKGEGRFSKGLMNAVLENNATPAIWITNTVNGVDPAYLRRFDLVVELKTPAPTIKKRIARRVFGDLPMEPDLVDRIVENRHVTPAHLQKLTKICRRLGVGSASETRVIVSQVLNGDLQAVRAAPLRPKEQTPKTPKSLPYRPDLVNCDADTGELAACIHADSQARLCLYGPPGTGKSAWARHLAKAMGRPLLVKQAADILDKYLGGTEQNIAAIFEEAKTTRSILMLDEVDSFLPDRGNATRHWEITQANQFLTAMEQFDGILLCTTNLMDNLDPATIRRFDFKIRFAYLTDEQAVEMAIEVLKTLDVQPSNCMTATLRRNLASLELSHGDFAASLRRYASLKMKPDLDRLTADLRLEAGFRARNRRRSIGFTAAI